MQGGIRKERPANLSLFLCQSEPAMCSPTSGTAQWPSIDIEATTWDTQNARLRSCNGAFVHSLGTAYDNEMYQQFFRRYHIADIMRGYELAQDTNLFNVARKYRDTDIRLLLKFVEDDALEFLEALKNLRGSDIIDLRDATFANTRRATNNQASMLRLSRGSHSHRLSNTSRDSGYASRPSSEVEGLPTSTLDQPCKSNLANCSSLYGDALPIDTSFSSDFSSPAYLAEARDQHSNSAYTPQSPLSFLGEPMASSPAATKPSVPRLFECMYCGQDFARYGYCLNHEGSYHNQRKKWICPHCDLPFNTKAGYVRHHRGHGCQQCEEPERVEVLSDLKTACACPYCGALFEGTSCFAIRANHIKTTHYKGEGRKTRADMDYSKMIDALLSRKELSEPWKNFMETKPNVKLSWTPEKARDLVDDLEFGEYTNGIHDQLQRVYDLADKLELPFDVSLHMATSSSKHGKQGSTKMASMEQVGATTGPMITGMDDIGLDTDSTDVVMDYEPAPNRPMRSLDFHSMSIAERTRQILANPPTERQPADTDSSKDIYMSHNRSANKGQTQFFPADLRENVFMGYGKETLDTLEPMDLVQDAPNPNPTLTRRSPTPPSQSWAFGELDGPLKHIEDMMMQQNLAYSAAQASSGAVAYTPPAWEDALPPSLRSATMNTALPPSKPLPTPPQRRIPRCSPLRY